MVDLIKKKRNGLELTRAEYSEIIDGLVSGSIPDYQISAFLMAVYFQGLSDKETIILTEAMMNSGTIIDLSEIKGIKVDKHSSGGVGDKTSLVLAPLVAAAGVPVAKMTGRGLGHTGGTIDKLESIPGLSLNLTEQEFVEDVKNHGIAICGQNTNLVPADKKLYALRDVTATVDNISLIASSIMSKKLACGADAMIIDIKVGEGAFMKTPAQAKELASLMIRIGSGMNKKVNVVVTGMDQPLGFAIGNALEVKEAIDTLKGNGPKDLEELCLTLGAHMLLLGEITENYSSAVDILKDLIISGQAFEKFKEFVQNQGGDINFIINPELLPQAKHAYEYVCVKDGYITHLNALNVGLASVKLGAGRAVMGDKIDPGAGILLQKKIGDYVKKDEVLAILFSNNKNSNNEAIELLQTAYSISKKRPPVKPLILSTMV